MDSDIQVRSGIVSVTFTVLLALLPIDSGAQVANSYNAYVIGSSQSVYVVNTLTKATIATIPLSLPGDDVPSAIAITPDGTRVLVLVANINQPSGMIAVIDTATNQVIQSIGGIGKSPQGLAISPDGRRAYATEMNSCDITQDPGCSMAIIDLTSFPYKTLPPLQNLGSHPEGVAVTPNSATVYVVNDDSLSVIDTTNNNHVSTHNLGNRGYEKIAIPRNANQIYVTNWNNNWLSVFNTVTFAETKIAVGQMPTSVAIHPDGTRAYVTSQHDHSVAVIDTSLVFTNPNAAVIATIHVAGEPFNVVVSADKTTAFVAADPGIIFEISTATNTVTNEIFVPTAYGLALKPVGLTPLVGNFSGDNKTDYLLIDSKVIYTFTGNGDGSFTEYTYNIPNGWAFGNPPSANVTPISGDLNGDGKTDFALIGNNIIFTFLSNGNGSYVASGYGIPYGWAFGNPASANFTPITGDFNGDGRSDFALIGNNTVYSFFSNGNGSYVASNYGIPYGWAFGSPPSASYTSISGDLNGDGRADFALIGNNTVFNFFSNGNGSYVASNYGMPNGWAFGSPPSASYTPISSDLNGDGRTDFALIGNNTVYSFFSNGDGSYVASNYGIPYGWAFGSPPSASYTPISGDLNGDGRADFALIGNNMVFNFFSNGNGSYVASNYGMPNGWAFGSPPSAKFTPVVGDLNGDGKTDFSFIGNNGAYSFLSNGNGSYSASQH